MIKMTEELKSLPWNAVITLICGYCCKTFQGLKRNYVASENSTRTLTKAFCSKQCQQSARGSFVDRQCQQCKSTFTVRKSSKRIFCHQSCAATWNNTHKTHGTRKSKLENWLHAQLIELYPQIEFHFNRKDAIGSELDIFVPSMRLAFELNGIYHYEPIHGNELLTKIQTNDTHKFKACHDNGISLCVIDTSSQKYFKESSAKQFLEIICSVVNGAATRT